MVDGDVDGPRAFALLGPAHGECPGGGCLRGAGILCVWYMVGDGVCDWVGRYKVIGAFEWHATSRGIWITLMIDTIPYP